ncbi:probable ribonuclease ZC3H12C [Leptopilina boulardi]|uniref:probable ribonuclease ZC3H12C n=1 Tax=Leptopilina boulardi TaxID=63433 RepID=UPI0021F58DE3|nr:probable ribonuclease ZC3H12C [Leptopilina boulardi]
MGKMRRSLRLTMKNTNYKSPLKRLQHAKVGKRQIEEDSSRLRPAKKLKLVGPTTKRHILNVPSLVSRRSSVIIINDENDIGPKTPGKKGSIQNEADDSVIILDDWHEASGENSTQSKVNTNQTEDITVVWSSVSDTLKKNNDFIPLEVEKKSHLNETNLQMLKGEYPQKWLGDWLAERKIARNKNAREIAKRIREKKRNTQKAEKIFNEKLVKTKEKLPSIEYVENSEIMQVLKIPNLKDRNVEIVQTTTTAAAATATTTTTTTKMTTAATRMENVEIEKTRTNGKLREIIIDGPNVAKAYTRGKFFSETGLKIVIDFFVNKGHKVVAFIPQHVRSRNRNLLEDLNRQGYVVFTPSRKAGSKVITPYDDRYILEYATKCNGIIISNDQFKDLYQEKPEWRETIENQILPPTFVGDHLMFPDDPLGRNGPKLDTFLRHSI